VLGYEELKRQWERADAEDEPHQFQLAPDQLKRMLTDANLVAFEGALGALLALAMNAPRAAVVKYVLVALKFPSFKRCRSAILSPVVEKALSSTRTATRAKAAELILALIDADTPAAPVVCQYLDFSHN
jgi:hypothetical protein